MEYTLKLHSAHHTYTLPRGLGDLMTDIAREILQNDERKQLINSSLDTSKVLRRHPQNIEGFIASYLNALVTTRNISKGLTKEVDDEETEAARMKNLYQQYGITLDEAHEFATKIQAFFRGWKTRVFIWNYRNKGKLRTLNRFMTPISERTSYKMASAAATKIQALFRGYITRKKKLLIARNTGDAWRPDWLWTEFQMVPEDIKKIRDLKEQKKKVIEDVRLVCIPKRGMEEVQAQVVQKTRRVAGASDHESLGTLEIIGLPEEDVENEVEPQSEAVEDLEIKDDFEEHILDEGHEVFPTSELEDVVHLEDIGAEVGFIEGEEVEEFEEFFAVKEQSIEQEGQMEYKAADEGGREHEFDFETITEYVDTETEVED